MDSSPSERGGPVNRSGSGLRGALIATIAATVLGSATGALLPFVITYVYEPRQTDPYFLTAGSVLTLTSIITIALKGTVVPFAISWRAISPGTAWSTANRISFWMALAATGLAAAGVVVLAFVVIPLSRLGQDEARIVLQCALALLPLPALLAWCSVLSGLLYSRESYFFATWSEAFRSLSALAVMTLPMARGSIWTVAVALSVGEGVRALLLRVSARKSLGLSAADLRTSTPQPLGRYWRVSLTQVFSLSIGGLSPFIDKIFASTQPTGSVTAMELAEKLFYMPTVLLASGVGIVIGTRWAAMAEADRWDDLVDDHRRWQYRLAAVSTVVAVAAIVVIHTAEPLLYSVLNLPPGIGFSALFAAYAIGLPFAMAASLGVRLYVACSNTKLLPWFAAVLLTVNTLGDAVGVALLGLVGIGLASTAYRLVDAILFIAFSKHVICSARAERRSLEKTSSIVISPPVGR